MSSDTVKRRGRPKKALTLEDVTVIEQSSPTKPTKASARKPALKNANGLASSTQKHIGDFGKGPQVQLQVDGDINSGSRAVKNQANSDGAKQEKLLTEGSSILQKATAFGNAAESATLASRSSLGLDEPEQNRIERTTRPNDFESKTTAGSVLNDAQVQTSSTIVKEREQQRGFVEQSSATVTQDLQSSLPPRRVATTVVDEDQTATLPHSAIHHATRTSSSGPNSVSSSEMIQATTPNKGAMATPSPLNSAPASAALPKIPSNPAPRLPASFAPPRPPPAPLRPTQMPYHELKKNPEFKALSRKYTSLIVAIPIAIFTSYVLFNRYTNQTVRRRIGDPAPAERSGGVKPRLLVEDAADAANINGDKRLLEE